MSRPLRPIALAALLGLAIGSPRPASAFDWLGKVQIDLEKVRDRDPQTRLDGVQALQQYAIEWTQEALLRALEDPDPRVRGAAGRVLGHHGVMKAAPIIIEWLAEPDPQTKQVAAEILGELAPPEAVPALIRSLGDAEPDVRARAAYALGQIGTPEVIVPLVGRLEDDSADVRKVAVEQLMNVGDTRSVVPLVGAFSDSSPEVQVAAILAVGRLGDTAAVPAIVRLLRDSDQRIQIAAVTALGNLHAERAADELVDKLRRGNHNLRSKAAFALGQIASETKDEAVRESCIQALLEALGDSQLRGAAREALLLAGRATVPSLVQHLDGVQTTDPTAAVALLRDIGDTRATPVLIRELERGRVSRELVLDALAQSGDDRALVPVLALLEDPDPAVRLRAMQALEGMIGQDMRAADIIVDMLGDTDLEIRVLAADYLGRMESVAAVDELVEIVRDRREPRRIRAASVIALGRIGDPRPGALLVEHLASGDLTQLCADALINLQSDKTIAPLVALVKSDRRLVLAEAVRALSGVVRDRPREAVLELLSRLGRKGPLPVALGAIDGLGSMGDKDARGVLLKILGGADPARQRAAAAALANLGRHGRTEAALIEALHARDDRLTAAAAWSLGDVGGEKSIKPLSRATRSQRFATPVNAAASIARLAGKSHAPLLVRLLHHRASLVRLNAIYGLSRLGSDGASKDLIRLLRGDPSPSVRAAAARALLRMGAGADERAAAAKEDPDENVRAAAGLAEAPAVPQRDEWKAFFVGEDGDEDPVAQEPYFSIGADGLAQAHYTDARGYVLVERFPAGKYAFEARSALSRF